MHFETAIPFKPVKTGQPRGGSFTPLQSRQQQRSARLRPIVLALGLTVAAIGGYILNSVTFHREDAR